MALPVALSVASSRTSACSWMEYVLIRSLDTATTPAIAAVTPAMTAVPDVRTRPSAACLSESSEDAAAASLSDFSILSARALAVSAADDTDDTADAESFSSCFAFLASAVTSILSWLIFLLYHINQLHHLQESCRAVRPRMRPPVLLDTHIDHERLPGARVTYGTAALILGGHNS